jgi:hypothetical protein
MSAVLNGRLPSSGFADTLDEGKRKLPSAPPDCAALHPGYSSAYRSNKTNIVRSEP